MKKQEDWKSIVLEGDKHYLPHISIDCVVLGFHDNQLRVLLLKPKQKEEWALPGGFVKREETVEEAGYRTLFERTGLKDTFLEQFHTFSDPYRTRHNLTRAEFKNIGIDMPEDNWVTQRFLTVGLYALVEFSKVVPKPNQLSDYCEWWDIHNVGKLILDHNHILDKALQSIRLQLKYKPIGYNLLPQKFTLSDLQKLYETILDKKLDRANFNRKMLSSKFLTYQEEKKTGVPHKAPFLYSFDVEKYNQALRDGLSGEI
ncbi:NUDIX hydrolase [Mucilaginibacter sp.]|jgi:ADP-ribose pyrophosphatase YjhB (NUDIX family)|uniref:NUDIX hydrolase n=1 Tax=Mucilaginibacter sp. TaxID=1882438 RepID=UPI002ED65507